MQKELLVDSTFDPNSTPEDISANYLNVMHLLNEANGETQLTYEQGDYSTLADDESRYHESIVGLIFNAFFKT